MDLAESILNEIVTLQKKNEDLVGIIRRLENESDVIIRQFEEKIADLNKQIKRIQDSAVKSEKKFETLVRESKKEREGLEKGKKDLEFTLSEKIIELEGSIQQFIVDGAEKDKSILNLTEEKEQLHLHSIEESKRVKETISGIQAELHRDLEQAQTEYNILSAEYNNRVSELNDKYAQKESELRTLASELKTRIAHEKEILKDREKERIKSEKILTDLKENLTAERKLRKKLESDYSDESARVSKNIEDLKNHVLDLEKSSANIQTELHSRIDLLVSENKSLEEKTAANLVIISNLQEENNRLSDNNKQYLSEIAQKVQEIETLYAEMDSLRSGFESRISSLTQDSEQNRAELTDKVQEIEKLHMEMDSLQSGFESRIFSLTQDNEQKDLKILSANKKISSLETEIASLRNKNQDQILSLNVTIEQLHKQEESLKTQLKEREDATLNKITELSSEIENLNSGITELEENIRQKDQREQEFRDEITHLHDELIKRTGEWKEHLESKSRDIAERDRHIILISGNNEALRSELERNRSRLLLLEKTIREDKEEPVHALYRQIQNLSSKLTVQESENSVLASRIIRLDTENTRLTQLLTENEQFSPDHNSSVKPETLQDKPVNSGSSSDPYISKYLSNLDDPMHAMHAAAEILRLGSQTIDVLIPLLYRGPLHRRAWIAVLLYEMNDPRATKPLSDLLDTSETGLRELIWDTRLRFREWRRSGTTSGVAQ